jgi:hypothetical protein
MTAERLLQGIRRLALLSHAEQPPFLRQNHAIAGVARP